MPATINKTSIHRPRGEFTFTEWYQENKDSELIRSMFDECLKDLHDAGYEKVTFKDFCKQLFDKLDTLL